ncbi:MAG: hypothetical protein U0521_10935 [Anaerolineae bacterium]
MHTGKRAHGNRDQPLYGVGQPCRGAAADGEYLGQHSAMRVLVIGAGEMAVLAAQALRRFDITDLTFVNRTHSRAEALAQEFGGKALTWYQLDEAVVWADARICATSAPHAILYRGDEALLPRRAGRPLAALDIAVPRDVEASVRDLPYAVLRHRRSALVVDANVEQREAAIPQVDAIIAEEMARFAGWYRGRQVTPVIKTLREWAQSIADEELTQTLNRLPDADEHTREIVGRMAHRMVNRLLHQPTAHLQIQASEGNGYGYAHAVRELFAIERDVGNAGMSLRRKPMPPNELDDTHICTLNCILPYTAGRQE